MYLEKVISGMQTGADLAGLKAGMHSRIETGGWCTKDFRMENGCFPWIAEMFNIKPCESENYKVRTWLNVRDSDITLWFGKMESLGFKCTQNGTRKYLRPFYIIEIPRLNSPFHVASMLHDYKFSVINVAGNRESKNPGIYNATFEFLMQVFEHLKGMKDEAGYQAKMG